MRISAIKLKIKSSTKGTSKVIGVVITLLLLSAFFLLVVTIFFGDGLLSQGMDKVRELIKGVPEVDPTRSEMDFFRNNDVQLKFLGSWNTAMKNALAGTVATQYGGCIMTLDSLEVDGFYKKGANYNLYLVQDGPNITMSLTRYAQQDTEKRKDKTETPVTVVNLEGAKLCIIEGASATEFYNEFNDINKGEVPDIKKIVPVPVKAIMISSGQMEKTKGKIGYNHTIKPKNESHYTWTTFFKKKEEKTTIYAIRLDYQGDKYVCLFPTYNDKMDVFSTCGAPKDGLPQTDCFDSNGGKRSLGYNFEQSPSLIPPWYICSNTAPVAGASALPAVTPSVASVAPAVVNSPQAPQGQSDIEKKVYDVYDQNLKSKMNTGDSAIVVLAGAGAEKLFLIKKTDNSYAVTKTYTISSSKFGYGFVVNSNMTPTGLHQIAEKVYLDQSGNVAPRDTVFVYKQSTGRLFTEAPYINSDEDLVTSRILSLNGLESQNANSFMRGIYIHGTNDEAGIGTPNSHGCIRMTNSDVIDLFNLVNINTLVYIHHYT